MQNAIRAVSRRGLMTLRNRVPLFSYARESLLEEIPRIGSETGRNEGGRVCMPGVKVRKEAGK